MTRAWTGLLALALFVTGMSPSSAGESTIVHPGGDYQSIQVAPTDNVYVAGTSALVVFDAWGAQLEVIEGAVPGEMAWLDGAMYAVASDHVKRIDGATHEVTATFPGPGGELGPTIAAGDGLLYVIGGGDVFSLDPDTGVYVDLGIDTTVSALLRTSIGLPGEVFVGRRNWPHTIERWDVDPLPAVQLATSAGGATWITTRDFEIDATGEYLFLVAYTSDGVEVFDAPTLAKQSELSVSVSPRGVAVSPSGRVAGVAHSFVALWDVGVAEPVRTWDVDTSMGSGAIAVSDDGERVYAAAPTEGTLHVLDLFPGAPHDVSVSAGDGTVSVSWEAADGFADEFTATASPGGATCVGPNTGCTIEGLTNGVSYTVTVTAANAVGEGPPSIPSAPIVPDLPPGAPSDIVFEPDGSIAWSAGVGGGPLEHSVTYAEYHTPGDWLAPLVVGGGEVGIGRHRHAVKLLAFDTTDDFLFECDGVFLTLEWVLTAAHCTEFFADADSSSPTRVSTIVALYGLKDWTGAIDDLAKHRRFSSQIIVRHQGWYDAVGQDLALVRLEQSADARYASPIPVGGFADPVDGDPVFLVGWGATETDGTPSDDLRGVELTIDGSCGEWSTLLGDDFVAEELLCTHADGAGACDGDSGGPIVVNRGGVLILAGIVSFRSVAGCAVDASRPDVHMRVSHNLDWIEDHVGPLSSSVTPSGSSASLSGLLPGRSYFAVVTASNDVGEATAIQTVDVAGQRLLTQSELGVDCTAAPWHPFVDVPATSFASHSVGCIYQLGVTTGTSTFTYSPADFVTRAQMAAFIARFFERVSGETCDGTHPFGDIAASSFAFGPVGCIFELGITKGTSAATYDPGAFVTREQMAAFLARLYRQLSGEPCGSEPVFGDVGAGSFAYLDVGCIHGLGVTTGTSPGFYSPSDLVTREQMAAFLERLVLSLI